MGRDTLKLEAPISVWSFNSQTWKLFWYKADYAKYMLKWHEQQAKQIRRPAKIKLDKRK